jgi:cell division protein FtsB
MASKRGGVGKRLGIMVVLAIAVAFAVEGGEFGTFDLLRQRREKARIQHSIDSLTRVVASLRAYKDSLERDPGTQERIAREVFGMVRGKNELVYRFTDSARDTSAAKKR